ncbi:ROK family protein [Paenibacillus sp. 1001270B_150601_E10]|uniref:ROK family protein n=1 Tax=Paenibacillus sp. 1001270B_150601_E10 TaxID=2787079 RepID=UPI0018A04720|nr:ROK family protein [Paenibacillus sp. 1001270B_150601_E10]
MTYAIGVDIGGTKVQFATINRQGSIVDRLLVPTEAAKGPDQLMKKVEDGIAHMIESVGHANQIAGIGIGSAGQIHYVDGSVWYAGETLPGWSGTPIKERIAALYPYPVYVDNDVNVLAVAEKLYGAAQPMNHFICLALGTGIGGAVMESGRLQRGVFGGAGELGHVSVDMNGPVCDCGNQGCVELYASGTGIARIGREVIAAAEGPVDWQPDAKEIVAAWMNGDQAADKVMSVVIQALGTAIAGYIHSFNPEGVLIGGSVSQAGMRFFDALDQEITKRTSPVMRAKCRIVPALLGADAGVIGAAAQVWYV